MVVSQQLKCIRKSELRAYCGRELIRPSVFGSEEWAFVDPAHALRAIENADDLQPCQQCWAALGARYVKPQPSAPALARDLREWCVEFLNGVRYTIPERAVADHAALLRALLRADNQDGPF